MRRLLLALGLVLPLSACQAETAPETLAAIRSGEHLLIDVRTPSEYAAGHLSGARQIAHDQIGTLIGGVAPDKDTPIVLYCRSGRRSDIARQTLVELGYTRVIDAGGYEQLQSDLADSTDSACSGNC
ncbi:Thiosulfate sulfurtransferase PspE precursor [compost metagenome]|jgi:phage shock protein E